MERTIQWKSGCYDEIGLVYEKAEKNEMAGRMLAELEQGALAEARTHSFLLQANGKPVTPEQFDTLPDNARESLMAALGNAGLTKLNADLSVPKIEVQLSPQIQQVRCCTAFAILNRLEKLDGAVNTLFPEVTLELQAPLGAKQGLLILEMLIVQLYPWLKVSEVSYSPAPVNPGQPQSAQPQSAAGTAPVQNGQSGATAPVNQQAQKVARYRKRNAVVKLCVILLLVGLLTNLAVKKNKEAAYNQELRNFATETMEESFVNVYANVVSVEPEYYISLTTNGTYSGVTDVICKCRTVEGKTIWIVMDDRDYPGGYSEFSMKDQTLRYTQKNPLQVFGSVTTAEEVAREMPGEVGNILVLKVSRLIVP